MSGILEPGEYCLSFAQAFMADVVEQLTSFFPCNFGTCLFVLLLYVPSQQLWSLGDGQFT